MTDAVLYARFSPGANHNGSANQSAEAQLAQCRAYCDFHTMQVIGTFADEGISGRSVDNRPGFNQAMELTCQRKAVLIVYSLSRFARSTKDAIEYAERIDKAGANLASLKEQIDTTTPVGRFTFRILAALAELEREQIAERTRDAMLYYQSQGRIMGSRIPYGFERDPDNPKRMIPCEREVEIIGLMQGYRAEGLSYRSIARRLWCEGVLGRRDCVFRMVKAGRSSGNKQRQTEEVIGRKVGMFEAKTIEAILKRAQVVL